MWGKQGLKSRRAELLFSILHTIPCISIQLLLMKSLLVSSILPLFTVSVLFYRIFSYFRDRFHLRDRQCGSDKHHHQPKIWQHSKNFVMLFYFIWASLCICLFQTGWENKVPWYQEEKLFKLMASTRFFCRSCHSHEICCQVNTHKCEGSSYEA